MVGFLSKITGSNPSEEEFNNNEEFGEEINYEMDEALDNSSDEISLAVDAFEDEDNLYIKTFIPAIDPKDLDIDISRDTVVISGERLEKNEKDYDQYFQRELSWGKFEKRILLPKEVDIENIKASVNHGVLSLKLPKIDKDRRVKVSIS